MANYPGLLAAAQTLRVTTPSMTVAQIIDVVNTTMVPIASSVPASIVRQTLYG